MSGAHAYRGRFVGRAQRLQSKLSGKRGGCKVITLERLDALLNEAHNGVAVSTTRPFNPPRIASSRATRHPAVLGEVAAD